MSPSPYPETTCQASLASRRSVLRICNLRKSFGGQRVLQGVSANLGEGEVVLLRGDNRSGKTTLINIISGHLEADEGKLTIAVNGKQETFEFPRPWWKNLNPLDHFTPERVASEGIGRTWQEPRLFNSLTLAENVALANPLRGENPLLAMFPMANTDHADASGCALAVAKLKELGLEGRESSSADRVSLGQAKRVEIARGALKARILCLDEPMAGLDGEGMKAVIQLLRRLVGEHRISLLIVEHILNIPRILDLADSVWTLHDGRIKVEAPADVLKETLVSQSMDVSSRIAAQIPRKTSVSHGILPGGATLTRIRDELNTNLHEPPLLEIRNLAIRRGKRLVIGEEVQGKQSLRSGPPSKSRWSRFFDSFIKIYKRITHNSGGLAPEIRGFSLKIYRNELCILQAPNGWGKSSLADAIMGLLPPDQGEITLCGRSLKNVAVWDRIALGLQYLQSKRTDFASLTLKDSLDLARTPDPLTTRDPMQDRRMGSLSGGERRGAAIATIKPSILGIYDEPLSMLDEQAVEGFCRELNAKTTCSALILLPSAS